VRRTTQDVLQGFGGAAGATISALFALYLALCFAPVCVALRETLVRLSRHLNSARSRGRSRGRLTYTRAPPHDHERAPDPSSPSSPGHHPDCASADAAGGAAEEGGGGGGGGATLPPLRNALVTAAIVGAALGVALGLPDASASLFALTGATGVCLVAYVLPIAAHWALPAALDGEARRRRGGGGGADADADAACDAAAAAGAPLKGWLRTLERGWLGLVLVMGVAVSALSLFSIVEGWATHQTSVVCVAPA